MYADGECERKTKRDEFCSCATGVQTWYASAPLRKIEDCFLRLGDVAQAPSTKDADRLFASIFADLKDLTGDVDGMGKYMILVRCART